MSTLTFHGPWEIEVVSLETDYAQRYVIAGSADRDGAYLAVAGDRLQVAGSTWTLGMEWNDRVSPQWHPSDVRKDARGDGPDGLTYILNVDDNLEAIRDRDYNDVVVRCTYMDPLASPKLGHPPLSFTLPAAAFRDPDTPPTDRCHRKHCDNHENNGHNHDT